MTDRVYSCKESPTGRHEFVGQFPACRHCHRRPVDLPMGWNVPADDPDAHLGAVEDHGDSAA